MELRIHHFLSFAVLLAMAGPIRASQTAVMTVASGRDAGPEEQHAGDQIVYVLEGEAEMRVGAERFVARPGALITIPAGTRHHVRNAGATPLFFLTVYAPPAY